jgi:hypothetical protein
VRALAPAVLATAALAACGGGPDTPEAVANALRARLEERELSVRSVACLASGLSFEGATAYRCTVNFGDPHLVPYCAALPDGELVTDRERPALRCYRPEDEERYRAGALLEPGPG